MITLWPVRQNFRIIFGDEKLISNLILNLSWWQQTAWSNNSSGIFLVWGHGGPASSCTNGPWSSRNNIEPPPNDKPNGEYYTVFFVWMFLRLGAFRMWAILCSLNFRAAFKFVILEKDFLSPHLYSAFGFCFFKKEEILSALIFKSKQSHFFPLHDFFDSHRNFHLQRQRPRRPLLRPWPSDSSTPSSSPKSPQHQFLHISLIRYYYWNAKLKGEKFD